MNALIVSGGSKGLGKAIVEQAQQLEWDVFEISRSGSGPAHIFADFQNPESAQKAMQNIAASMKGKTYAQILLVNNACTLSPMGFATTYSTAELIQTVNTNITSAMILMSEYLKQFRNVACEKMLVNISSGAASKGYPGWSMYCASKASTDNWIRAVYEEEKYAQFPFRVFNFNPSVMDTQMQDQIRASGEDVFPAVERFRQLKKDQRLLAPKRVAEALIRLVQTPCPESSYDVLGLI